MSNTPLPWRVERHDLDDGSINYEIWSEVFVGVDGKNTIHRVVTLNDWDNEHARDDAALIVQVINHRICGK